MGVFICHCGHNIASVVDVEQVAEEAGRACPTSCHAETSLYTCSDTNQQHIKDMISEHRLNRLVVASCSPRTHEVLFQETLRDSGPEPVPVRDGQHPRPVLLGPQGRPGRRHREGRRPDVAWPWPGRGTCKALQTGQLPVTASALVLGGGLAGMTAALGIADQGFPVHLVEKEAGAGRPAARRPQHARRGRRRRRTCGELVAKVQAHPRINVYLNATPASITGHVGNFKSVLERGGHGEARQPRRGDRRHRRPGAAPPSSTCTARTRT